ncbi:hypothetical protein BX070DRAFT_226927 [Coemansia spiralis]|nr:hypothetical protein BX070DRAFT_226927 [Coemansia spiralis]
MQAAASAIERHSNYLPSQASSDVDSASLIQTQARDLKHELKAWEAAFTEKHGRMPAKQDLARLPDIINKYKHYSKLKKQLTGSGVNVLPVECRQKSTQVNAAAVEEKQAHINYKFGLMDLPLETSILRGSVKRKTGHIDSNDTAQQSATTKAAQQQLEDVMRIDRDIFLARDIVGARAANACKDPFVETPKRQRTALPLDFSIKPVKDTVAEPNVIPHIPAPTPTFTNTADVSSDNDMVAYTPPPSLIRRYYTHKRQSASSQTSEVPLVDACSTHSPLVPSLSAMSVCDVAAKDTKLSVEAVSARVLDLGIDISRFKARAGKLVKTTSIPLSAFGAQFRGASQILSSQFSSLEGSSHEEPTAENMLMGSQDQLDPADLVMDDDQEDSQQTPDGQTSPNKAAHKKKATQKRSTRRVKIKPIAADGTSDKSTRSSNMRSQNLVSNNFYKLKLKGRKHGAPSAEGRRTALYKRMIGKKKRDHVNSVASSAGNDAEFQQNECSNEDFDDEYLYSSSEETVDPAINANNNNPLLNTRSTVRSAKDPYAIAGRPLHHFYAEKDKDIDASYVYSPSSMFGLQRNSHTFSDDIVIDLRKVLRHAWGFTEFKHNQAEAIKNVLNARSTLLLLATGAGKSLVYQLPTLILSTLSRGITIVVTPLISLMRDQIRKLPSCLQAICMSSEAFHSESYSETTLRLISGEVQLLFVSPERLQSPRFQEMMVADGMPSIQMAVIDEAHCASEWSHNFRPAYLQLPQMLQKLGANCILAMTGTATASMANCLCNMFNIDANCDVMRGDVVRDNIGLEIVHVDVDTKSISRSTAREDALVNLLKSPSMVSSHSILVYVATQANADRIAEYLTARSIPAQSYHAGKPAAERARIQAAFMHENLAKLSSADKARGSIGSEVPIRVLVATVAFGMGLDKADIRAVIHFNLPRSMEAYVQEVGRAGRDGAPARGVLLLATHKSHSALQLDSQNTERSVDAVFTRSWVHADGIDISSVRRLLHRIFSPEFVRQALVSATLAHSKSLSPESHEWKVSETVVIGLKRLESDVDADHTVVQTLINYLALKEPNMVRVEPNTHRKCLIRFVRTDLGKLAEMHWFFKELTEHINSKDNAKAATARRASTFMRISGAKKAGASVEVDIFALATKAGIVPSEVVAELHRWRAKKEVVLDWQEPSCVINIALDMSRFANELVRDSNSMGKDNLAPVSGQWDEQLAQYVDKYITDLAESICHQHESRINDSINRVNIIESTMLAAAQLEPEHQNKLIQYSIRSYFAATQKSSAQMTTGVRSQPSTRNSDTSIATAIPVDSEVLLRIRKFIEQHSAKLTSGRAIARVLHGLSSPSSPASQWSWCAEWGSLVWTDFEAVRQCAQEELVKMHCCAGKTG